MANKVQKIREEVIRLKSQLLRGACSSQVAIETRCKEEAYNEVLAILDTMQEEPKSKFEQSIQEGDNIVYNEDLGCRVNLSQLDRVAKKKESVSEDNNLRKASEEYLKVLSETPYNNTPITNAQTIVRELITFMDNPLKYNPNHIEEPVSEDLRTAANVYVYKNAKEEWSDCDMHNAFVTGANWQRQQDNNDANHALVEQIKTQQMCYEKGMADMKQQMMKEAVDATVCGVGSGDGEFMKAGEYSVCCDVPRSNIGDKVKLIILKED